LHFLALFNAKMSLFVTGRKDVFLKLSRVLNTDQSKIWIHAASLGEFEQGKPLIEELKKTYPQHQIVLTFFSPSGYEVRKNYPLADVVTYLPLDTIKNAKKFVNFVDPSLAIFIKYEFWPNYLHQLKKAKISTVLISGIFREKQFFFKPQGFFMRKYLKGIQYFFVQDKTSKKLLNTIGVKNVTITGDTRFDSVKKIVDDNVKLPFMSEFKNNQYTTVAGSTWPKDEEDLIYYINEYAHSNEKFIIAPHNIHKEQIQKLKKSIDKKVVLYSEMENKSLQHYDVFVVDTIGILSKIYAYANVAYIGGGYTKSGVHNTLEAATYGLPIVIGPNFKKFKEVKDLVALTGCISLNNKQDLVNTLSTFYQNKELREEKAKITKTYVTQNLGATQKIMYTISQFLVHEA